MLAERVHQIFVAVTVLDQLGKQGEESGFGLMFGEQVAGLLDQILDATYHDGFEQGLLGGKMPVECSDTDAGAIGNFVDRRGQAGGSEDFPRGLYDLLLVAGGVSAHRDTIGS